MEYTFLQFILNVLENVDVINHRGSICNGWLTSYGKELLSNLNKLTEEDMESALEDLF